MKYFTTGQAEISLLLDLLPFHSGAPLGAPEWSGISCVVTSTFCAPSQIILLQRCLNKNRYIYFCSRSMTSLLWSMANLHWRSWKLEIAIIKFGILQLFSTGITVLHSSRRVRLLPLAIIPLPLFHMTRSEPLLCFYLTCSVLE